MTRLLPLLIALLPGLCHTALAATESLAIPWATRAPIADGHPDPQWEGVPSYPIRELLAGELKSPDDLAASWQAVWDDDHLYLLVTITDERGVTDAAGIKDRNDSVAVFIDVEPGRAERRGWRQTHYTFKRGAAPYSGTAVEGVMWGKWLARLPSATKPGEILKTAWRVEARFPWKTLGGRGDKVGLQFHLIDYDDPKAPRAEAQLVFRPALDGDVGDPRCYGVAQLLGANGAPVRDTLPSVNLPFAAGSVVFSDDFSGGSRGPTIENTVHLPKPAGMGYATRYPQGFRATKWVHVDKSENETAPRGFWAISERGEYLVQAGRSQHSAIFTATPMPSGAERYDIDFVECRNDNDYIGFVIGASRPAIEHDGIEFGYETQLPTSDYTMTHFYYKGALGENAHADRGRRGQWIRHRIEVRGKHVRWLQEGFVIAEKTVSAVKSGGHFGIIHRAERDTRYDDVRITVLDSR